MHQRRAISMTATALSNTGSVCDKDKGYLPYTLAADGQCTRSEPTRWLPRRNHCDPLFLFPGQGPAAERLLLPQGYIGKGGHRRHRQVQRQGHGPESVPITRGATRVTRASASIPTPEYLRPTAKGGTPSTLPP